MFRGPQRKPRQRLRWGERATPSTFSQAVLELVYEGIERDGCLSDVVLTIKQFITKCQR